MIGDHLDSNLDARSGGAGSGRGVTLDIKLSPRELEVLQWIAYGQTYKKIAAEMGITDRTVGTYVKNIRKKCGCQTIAASVAIAVAFDMVMVDRRREVRIDRD